MDDDFSTLMDMLLTEARRAGADAAEGIVAASHGHSVAVRMGVLESVERSEDHDIGLRVFVGKRNASISTSRLDPESISMLAERAVAMAKLAPEDPYAMLAQDHQLEKSPPELDIFDATTPSTDTLKDRALAAEDAARSVKGISNSEGGDASHGVIDMMMATSNGFSGRYQRSNFGCSAMVLAEQDGVMERDYDYSSAVYEDDLKDATEIGKRAGTRTIERLGARRPPTGTFPVIYNERVSRSIASHIATAINGSAVARGTSFLKDKMGEAIASSTLTMIDDPLRPRGMASSPFDGEGLKRQKRIMVEGGILKGWFLDLASAKQLNLEPTGNARGSGAGPSNWMMQAGELSRDDLIASVDDGFLVTEMIGSSVNMITGDYSRGASGFWIKNGVISHPVSEATIAGNLIDMLKAMTLADDLDFTQATIAPSLRIDGMTVAGGG